MISRFLFVLIFLFPLAACAQETPATATYMPNASEMAAQNNPLPPPPGSTPGSMPIFHAPDASPTVPLPLPPKKVTPPNTTVPPGGDMCARPLEMLGKSLAVFQHTKPSYTYRVLSPGSAATMDYSPSRTNFITDRQGIIVDIRCG